MLKKTMLLLFLNILLCPPMISPLQAEPALVQKTGVFGCLSPRLLLTQPACGKIYTASLLHKFPAQVLAEKLMQDLKINSLFKSLLINTIKKYGYALTRETLELIKQKPRQNQFIIFDFETIKTITKATAQLGKNKVLTPLSLQNIQTPIPGEFEIMPATVTANYFGGDRDSLYFSFFPNYPDQDIKFKNNNSREWINHVPQALAFIQFYIQDNQLIITTLQSDLYNSLTNGKKKMLKNWPEMMLAAIEAFAGRHNIDQIIMPDSLPQLKRFKDFGFPQNIALRLYEQAPQNQNFRKRKNFEKPAQIEDITYNTCWIKDIRKKIRIVDEINNNRLKLLQIITGKNQFISVKNNLNLILQAI